MADSLPSGNEREIGIGVVSNFTRTYGSLITTGGASEKLDYTTLTKAIEARYPIDIFDPVY